MAVLVQLLARGFSPVATSSALSWVLVRISHCPEFLCCMHYGLRNYRSAMTSAWATASPRRHYMSMWSSQTRINDVSCIEVVFLPLSHQGSSRVCFVWADGWVAAANLFLSNFKMSHSSSCSSFFSSLIGGDQWTHLAFVLPNFSLRY